MASIYITNKINKLLDEKVKSLKSNAKEGLAHSILLLALTNHQFMVRAKELNAYLGDVGVTNLENQEL